MSPGISNCLSIEKAWYKKEKAMKELVRSEKRDLFSWLVAPTVGKENYTLSSDQNVNFTMSL